MTIHRVKRPLLWPFSPGKLWSAFRRFCQLFSIFAIIASPFLGGWQRLDRNDLSAWDGRGWDLPAYFHDILPLGDIPPKVYSSNLVLGGGSGVDYFHIPILDPVAGVLVVSSGHLSRTMLIAWLLPIVLGLLGGRVFCGWFCPFGTLSRIVDGIRKRLPWVPPTYALPKNRWLRWAILAGCLALGMVGMRSLLYALLPHVVFQQSVYSLWLLGGISTSLGWLFGFMVAGYIFGPTLFCAGLCPTGSALSLLGNARVARLALEDPIACGKNCNLCSRFCWLQLDPATGDPGPDCDLCARCTLVCPKNNLRIGWNVRKKVAVPVTTTLLIVASLFLSSPVQAQSYRDSRKPHLVFETRKTEGAITVALSAVVIEGMRLDADNLHTEQGTTLDLVIVQGKTGKANEFGKLPSRTVYHGPIRVVIERKKQPLFPPLMLKEPNWMPSTPKRHIYHFHFQQPLLPEDKITISPIPNWTTKATTFTVPWRKTGGSIKRFALGFTTSLLAICGLLSLALIAPKPTPHEK
jgi:ferredoxin-type protein NapH